MESAKPSRKLIVNADDFGASESINAAVIQAHRNGILTSASIMVNGSAFAQAVEMAKANPALGVGLHLSLSCGTSSLAREQVPSLVDSERRFADSPVLAGVKYFFSSSARQQIAREIDAQFAKFADSGLRMDHLNGHLHFHLHPTVFSILKSRLEKWRVRAIRLTYDPAAIDLPLGSGRWGYRLSHALIFRILSTRARKFLHGSGIKHTDFVFGLLENALVNEEYVLRLMKVLPAGYSELYSHPSLDEFKHEYEALVSPRVIAAVEEQDIKLIRYQDL
jgi:hopanoid biosynthesis associated protein HpnK